MSIIRVWNNLFFLISTLALPILYFASSLLFLPHSFLLFYCGCKCMCALWFLWYVCVNAPIYVHLCVFKNNRLMWGVPLFFFLFLEIKILTGPEAHLLSHTCLLMRFGDWLMSHPTPKYSTKRQGNCKSKLKSLCLVSIWLPERFLQPWI